MSIQMPLTQQGNIPLLHDTEQIIHILPIPQLLLIKKKNEKSREALIKILNPNYLTNILILK